VPVRRSIPALAAGIVIVAGSWGAASPAQAQNVTCSFSITDFDFGQLDLLRGVSADLSGTVSVSCNGPPRQNIRACVSIGAGSGGATGAAERLMTSGRGGLRFGLFSDGARSVPLGSFTAPVGGAGGVELTLVANTLGASTVSAPIYARVFANQANVSAGSYTSRFAGNDAQIVFGPAASIPPCNAIGGGSGQVSSPSGFSVRAQAMPSCVVSGATLDFGPTGFLGRVTDGQTTLAAVCTNGTAYTVGLNGGQSNASDPAQRRMRQGKDAVIYGLFLDASRTRPFGDITGSNTFAGTGDGTSQSIPVFGRVPAQPTPPAGTYTDQVIVTLTF